MIEFQSKVLNQVTNRDRKDAFISCVAVCHNEFLIIKDFLDHYRSIGIQNFYIVDDHSTDGTYEFLIEQKDVNLFRPINGSEYKNDVAIWRQDILNFFLDKKWVTLPDIDEFLYYKQMPAEISEVANSLEEAGNEVLLGVMIDMYQDRPLSENRFSGNRKLVEEFPFFDGQGEPPTGIRIISQQRKYVRRFPTPEILFKGGVRDRLFFQDRKASWLQKWLLKKFAHPKRAINPTFLQRVQSEIVQRATKALYPFDPPMLNKFALIKWRAGLRFRRGPHCVSERMRVSEGLAVLLHFRFYKGEEMIRYNIQRGQHTGGSAYYKKILENRENLEKSPMCSASKKFDGIESLKDILR